MLCYIQVATLTHGVLLLIPFVLLLVQSILRHQGIHQLVKEPLHLLWPRNHSRFGLAREQASATRFVAATFFVKVACCSSFWFNPDFTRLMQEVCPTSLRKVSCDIYTVQSHEISTVCAERLFIRGSPDSNILLPQIKRLYQYQDGACWHHCSGPEICSPWVHELEGLHLHARCHPGHECTLRCCQCLQCELSPSTPDWLKPGCAASAFVPETPRELFCGNLQVGVYQTGNGRYCDRYQPLSYYTEQTWHSENAVLAQLARCVLTHKADPLKLQVWWSVTLALQLLPTLALGAWLLLSLALPMLLQEEALSMLGGAASDATLIQEVDDKARTLRQEISRKRLTATVKDKAMLYMEFGFFLLDYFSDYNCLFQMILEQQYGIAVAQAVMIVIPVALDCYRGKVQVVEVVGGFMKARKAGFPTNAYILALRSEKGVEAPLSFCLQYDTLLRATSFGTVWSVFLSLPLSVMSMSKRVYSSFELNMFDVVADESPAPRPRLVYWGYMGIVERKMETSIHPSTARGTIGSGDSGSGSWISKAS